MRHIKSERLKKLESELQDLEQWLKLGLVSGKLVLSQKEVKSLSPILSAIVKSAPNL